ncbi:hypothetical protein [Pontibacillus litoralis]|uniref:Uncharacterized protein n=1 Tax=Pontibacillus litoralis JSM 072002 TaxID=1385512 RepID=A0A0A5FYA9_9BACI|nr:hypothetical protein [Pontibacillus litoralis]KGX84779.1 hypothetical protein N784_11855 [Pontibacillus litoralis JSM 072002]
MYSVESFETIGAFTLLRPVFVTLTLVVMLLLLFIIIPKLRKKIVNGFAVVSISFVSVILSGQLLYYDAIIVDELGLSGDEFAFILFLIILVLSLVNLGLYMYYSKQG